MTVSKPAITFIGTHGNNIWAGKGQKKLALVAHVAQGSMSGCDSWFSNPQAQASANYCVDVDGTIHCYVDPFGPDAPYANGLVQNPDSTVQALIQRAGGANLNWCTVSIEHAGFSGTPLTAAQLDASAHLAAWLCEQLGIPADEEHLIGHYEIDSVSRAHCPGWDRAGWLAWEAAINRYLTPAPGPVVPANLKDAGEQLDAIIGAAQRAKSDLVAQAVAVMPAAYEKGAP